MIDFLNAADLIVAELNNEANGLLPEGVEASRQWELIRHRTDYETLRVSVIPQPIDPKDEEEDESTRGEVAEKMMIHIGVQKKVKVTHTESLSGRDEIRYHDKTECDAVARIGLNIGKAMHRARITTEDDAIRITQAHIHALGPDEHLQLDIFTAVIELEIASAYDA